jgi:hypothetical protein
LILWHKSYSRSEFPFLSRHRNFVYCVPNGVSRTEFVGNANAPSAGLTTEISHHIHECPFDDGTRTLCIMKTNSWHTHCPAGVSFRQGRY